MEASLYLAFFLIAAGLALLACEVFIPSGGLLFILSMVATISGIVMVFFTPESQGGGMQMGVITLAVVFVLIPMVVGVAFYYWPRTPMGKRFFLQGPEEDETVGSMEGIAEMERFRDQVGKTLMPLRPSGTVLIDGERVDSKSEGLYVDIDQWVRVIGIQPGVVVVRPLTARELADFPVDTDSI